MIEQVFKLLKNIISGKPYDERVEIEFELTYIDMAFICVIIAVGVWLIK